MVDWKECPLCEDSFNVMVFLMHLAGCYFKYCLTNNIAVLCTCPSCKGERTHPTPININNNNNNNYFSPTQLQAHSQTHSQTHTNSHHCTCESCSTHSPSIESPLAPSSSTSQKSNEATIDQVQGNTCICCGRKRENKLPGITKVGRYREFRVCMKGELKEKEPRKIIEQRMDAELKKAKESGDAPPAGYEPDSQDPDAQTITIENNKNCAGYLDDDGQKLCNAECSELLSYETSDGKNTYYFCKSSHFLRYAVKHATGSRKKKKKNN
eukprot:TRINITY_DN15336_c0_g2_i2.p1 TRINITY_DN15336_c0_g2~~TRINITY_DN15336_c0_g2_i2.p1  ORF type:complete len:268 (-),score=60.54 TRINITY_DN15336_c0_g2_i2:80-883(-)